MLTWAVAWLFTKRKDFDANIVSFCITVSCISDMIIFYAVSRQIFL